MEETVVFAICGKSCSGKNTLLNKIKDNYHVIISDTTRPKRQNEKDGIDYNFISLEEFVEKAYNGEYIEYTSFRGWEYGTPLSAIKNNKTNIGIFSPKGLKKMQTRNKNNFKIVPIYLRVSFFEQLKRAYKRENGFKIEHLRRAIFDMKDFLFFDKYLKDNFPENSSEILLHFSVRK